MTSEVATDIWAKTAALRFGREMALEFKQAAWKLC